MSEKIKPCPFCGCSDISMYTNGSDLDNYSYIVECDACGCTLDTGFDSEERAIEEWNCRQKSKPMWIPFEVALPKDRQKVLCINKHDEMMVGGYLTDYGMTFPCYYEKPVAWMPLPEPWRGEK